MAPPVAPPTIHPMILPTSAIVMAAPRAASPPRRRTSFRVAARPPGSDGLDRGDDGDAGTHRSYGAGRSQRTLSNTSRVAVLTALLWCSTRAGEHVPRLAHARVVVVLAAIALVLVSRRTLMICLVAVACGLAGGSSAWHGASRPVVGECRGVATLVKDPVALGRGVSTVVSMNGVRYSVVAHGRIATRLIPRLAGESLRIEGRCAPVAGRSARWNRIAHVVGTLAPSSVSEEFSTGSMAARASNRLRGAIGRGVASMSPTMRSLFMGLVIGDDRDQPRSMIMQFRGSGLSHLCAVSGQNVSYLLAAMSPLLRRRRRHTRWLVTLGLISWFAMLTRGEPSVLRAGVMAAFVATNAAVGVALNARLVLCATVASLLLIDPMLAWSVGFALSVGATAGLAWVSATLMRVVRVPMLGRRIPGLDAVVASTLAAQVGTMPVSLAVFGSVPVVSMVTNPLAIAVAGAVMMVGLPVALASSMIPALEPIASVVMSIPVGWVGAVARVGSAVGPTGVANTVLWVVLAASIWFALRKNGANREPDTTRVRT